MNKPVSITRRTALVALAVGSAALAVPAVAATVTQPSAVIAAIATHKAAHRNLRRIWREVERLESLPGRPPIPRVVFSHLITGYDAEGNKVREPMYAYSHRDLTAECVRHCYSVEHLWGQPGIERTRQRYDGLHRELTRMIRARKRFDRASGLLATEARQAVATEAEWRALAALILARPATEAEANAKRRYVERNALTREWWESPDGLRLIHEGLMQVAP